MSASEDRTKDACTRAYRRYVLGILTLVYGMNFVDRNLMSLLLEPIKEDLHLSDSQLGFLTGIAFGLFYAALGLPIARWADRGNRAKMTSIAIALWSATVMSCLAITGFAGLVFARVAAGVGEAGCMPPTYSLIGDYFPGATERTRAMSMYWLASPIAAMFSFAMGGWISTRVGWRMTFFLMGAPGLLLAALVRMTVQETRAFEARWDWRGARPPVPICEVVRLLWSQRASRNLSVAIILLWTIMLGLAPWYASFMLRSHGMSVAALGRWLGLIFGVSGVVGIVGGGCIAVRWFSGNESGQMQTNAVTIGATLPCFALFLLLPEAHQALLAMSVLMILLSIFVAPAFSLLQRLVPDHMRATSVALIMLIANLVGMGLGSQVIGVLSDALRPRIGNDSLRYAMLITSLLTLWAAYHFWRAAQTVKEDLAAMAHEGLIGRAATLPEARAAHV